MSSIRPTYIDRNSGDATADFQNLLARRQDNAASVAASVATIIDDIKNGGDAALLTYGKKFDHIPETVSEISDLMITPSQTHLDGLPKELQSALRLSMARIEKFHQELFDHYKLEKDFAMTDDLAVELGLRWTAIEKLGIYVPGGLAAYPSSVLMNAIPARVAGVKNIIMVCPFGFATPPQDKNFSAIEHAHPLVLAAAYLAGVSSVLCLGGAGAVAAMAYGTKNIMAVDKIVGPGNEFVAEAKRQVFGKVGIDMIAGPSEILVLADGSAHDDGDSKDGNNKDGDGKDRNNADADGNMLKKAEWIGLDLISQAEHDPRAMAVLITDHEPLATAVMAQVEKILTAPSNDADHLAKQKIAIESWRNHGAVVVVDDVATSGVALANIMAAEHVEVMTAQPAMVAKDIKNAGAIFLGGFSPEAFGDYMAGPSHVLPTSQSARFSSGLSLFDFLKRTSIVRGNQRAMAQLGGDIVRLAEQEKLPHHGRSITSRLPIID